MQNKHVGINDVMLTNYVSFYADTQMYFSGFYMYVYVYIYIYIYIYDLKY